MGTFKRLIESHSDFRFGKRVLKEARLNNAIETLNDTLDDFNGAFDDIPREERSIKNCLNALKNWLETNGQSLTDGGISTEDFEEIKQKTNDVITKATQVYKKYEADLPEELTITSNNGNIWDLGANLFDLEQKIDDPDIAEFHVMVTDLYQTILDSIQSIRIKNKKVGTSKFQKRQIGQKTTNSEEETDEESEEEPAKVATEQSNMSEESGEEHKSYKEVRSELIENLNNSVFDSEIFENVLKAVSDIVGVVRAEEANEIATDICKAGIKTILTNFQDEALSFIRDYQ